MLILALLLQQKVLAGTLRDAGISAYNAGQVAQAQKDLEQWVSQYPLDRLARYYLAHCLLSQGQTKEAAQNYTACCTWPKPDYISIAAKQALDLIAAKSQGASAGLSSATQVNNDAIEKQESVLVARIKDEEKRSISEKQELLELQIENSKARLKGQIASLTRYIWIDGKKMEHPDYAPSVSSLNEQAYADQMRMTEAFNFAEANIRQAADKKIADLEQTARGMKKQMRSTHGAIGLIPDGTDLNVRNYMNFPDASESDYYRRPTVPLRAGPAQMLKLDPKVRQAPQNRGKMPENR